MLSGLTDILSVLINSDFFPKNFSTDPHVSLNVVKLVKHLLWKVPLEVMTVSENVEYVHFEPLPPMLIVSQNATNFADLQEYLENKLEKITALKENVFV